MDISSPQSAAQDILQLAKDDWAGGMVTMEYQRALSVVQYRFFPLGLRDVNSELGVRLALKTRDLYEKTDFFQAIRFDVYLPYDDLLGHREWRQSISFTVDRELFGEINWDNVYRSNLLKIARDVQLIGR